MVIVDVDSLAKFIIWLHRVSPSRCRLPNPLLRPLSLERVPDQPRPPLVLRPGEPTPQLEPKSHWMRCRRRPILRRHLIEPQQLWPPLQWPRWGSGPLLWSSQPCVKRLPPRRPNARPSNHLRPCRRRPPSGHRDTLWRRPDPVRRKRKKWRLKSCSGDTWWVNFPDFRVWKTAEKRKKT